MQTYCCYRYYTMNSTICQVETVEVLQDKSATGKVRPWAIHKANAQIIAEAYASVDLEKAERMFSCADYLVYHKKEGGGMKLHDARFCRVRLCPICQWRRSLKTYAQMAKVLEVARSEGYEFLMLTLTIQNVYGDSLSEALDDIMLAFNRLSKYKEFKQAVKGWYRGCEVTHNLNPDSEWFDTYHPHFHIILAVRKSYFKGRYYIKQEKYFDMWEKALQGKHKVNRENQRINKCYGGYKSIAEACKYTTKASDIICTDNWQMTVDTLAILDTALNKRRFIGLGGVLKEIHKKLNLSDIDDDSDLIHTDDDTDTEELNPDELIFFWNGYNQRYER